jgi:hypothetical protein
VTSQGGEGTYHGGRRTRRACRLAEHQLAERVTADEGDEADERGSGVVLSSRVCRDLP